MPRLSQKNRYIYILCQRELLLGKRWVICSYRVCRLHQQQRIVVSYLKDTVKENVIRRWKKIHPNNGFTEFSGIVESGEYFKLINNIQDRIHSNGKS